MFHYVYPEASFPVVSLPPSKALGFHVAALVAFKILAKHPDGLMPYKQGKRGSLKLLCAKRYLCIKDVPLKLCLVMKSLPVAF